MFEGLLAGCDGGDDHAFRGDGEDADGGWEADFDAVGDRGLEQFRGQFHEREGVLFREPFQDAVFAADADEDGDWVADAVGVGVGGSVFVGVSVKGNEKLIEFDDDCVGVSGGVIVAE